MSVLEIILLAAGVLLVAASFFVPGKEDEPDEDISRIVSEEVKKSIDAEAENIRKHVDDVVNEAVAYAEEKTERTLERLTNEKIMAVNEYSDTVLEEINKNHKEVMFLYDMLNDKHKNLKSTVTEASEVTKEAKKTTEELKARTQEETATAEKPAAASKPSAVATPADDTPAQVMTEPVKHTSAKAVNFFSGLEAEEAQATIKSVTDEEKPREVRTLNWAELAVSDANEAEKKEAAKEGREPENVIEGSREKINREVIELAESGMDTVEIAKKLKMGVGEVGLILGLHNR